MTTKYIVDSKISGLVYARTLVWNVSYKRNQMHYYCFVKKNKYNQRLFDRVSVFQFTKKHDEKMFSVQFETLNVSVH